MYICVGKQHTTPALPKCYAHSLESAALLSNLIIGSVREITLKLSTYKDDMAKTLEVMARQQGLSTTYDKLSPTVTGHKSKQQSAARRKRIRIVDEDDTDGPPDTKKKFQGETPKKSRDKRPRSSQLKELTNFKSHSSK